MSSSEDSAEEEGGHHAGRRGMHSQHSHSHTHGSVQAASSSHGGRRRERQGQGQGQAEGVSLTTRLLQETDPVSEDEEGERGRAGEGEREGRRRFAEHSGGRRSHAGQELHGERGGGGFGGGGRSRLGKTQGQGQHLVRSPDSDQNSSADSDVLSVENRLKGLIQAALQED